MGGVVITVSPSQIRAWRACRRKWAWQKIEGVPDAPSDKARFGTEVHAHLERWVKEGTPPPASSSGDVARELVPLTRPPRDAGAICEHEFRLPGVVSGAELHGFIDVLDEREGVVVDYKTTTDLKWALDEERLRVDVQALIYALVAMARTGRRSARARWLYAEITWPRSGQPQPKGRRVVETTIARGDPVVEEALRELLEDVADIRDARIAARPALEHEANPAECGAYGGCPFRGRCNLSPSDRLRAIVERHDREHARRTQGVDNGNPVPVLVRETEDRTMGSLLDKINAAKARAVEAAPAEAPVAAAEAPAPAEAPATASALVDRLRKKNAEKGAVPPPAEAAPAKTPAEAAPTEAAAEAAPTEAPETGRGKWARCGIAGCKKKAAPDGLCAEHTRLPGSNTTTGEAPAGAAAALEGLRIGVAAFDCAFAKNVSFANGVVHLSTLIEQAAAKVAARHKAPHWALSAGAPGDHYVDRRAELVCEVRALLDAGHVGVLLADTRAPETMAVYDVIVERAGVVIRGVR